MTDWLKRAEKCLDRLLETDRQLAELKTKHVKDQQVAKRTHSAVFDRLEGQKDASGRPLSVKARESKADNHEKYLTAQAAELTSLLEYEAMKNERFTADKVVDFWKSWQRAKREGEI